MTAGRTVLYKEHKIKRIVLVITALLIPLRLSASEPVPPDVLCMAEALYYEARDQSFIGQLAVAIVIRNRMKDPRWPPTACEVVRDGRYWNGHPVRNKCQFSYWCDGKPERPMEKEAWGKAINLASLVFFNEIEIENFEKITHYHAITVRPSWANKLESCGQIGGHKFYTNR